MSPSLTLSARLYRFLLRRLVPSLSPGYAREAEAVFRAAGVDAWTKGPRAFVAFAWREVRHLLRSALSERRSRRAAGAGGSPGPSWPAGSGKRGAGKSLAAGVWDVLSLDLRYAVRNLARAPGFVVVSIASLTFGIGTAAGLFTIVNAALLRPLPLAREPEALVRVFSAGPTYQTGPISYPDFLDIRERTQTLEDLAVLRGRSLILGQPSEGGRPARGLEVSENYFDVLGIPMARGRAFLPEDITAGGQVAVIGHQFWQDRFGGDPHVLGRTLRVDGKPFTVVGVAPEGMVSPASPELAEVVVPIMEFRDERGRASITGVGRMRKGVTIAQVRAELAGVTAHLREEYPDYWAGDRPRQLTAMTFREALLPGNAQAALVAAGFLTVVGLILLIACSNVANLLLTRAWRRRGEVAVRSALGAPRRRILGQLFTENLLLFGIAGMLSVGFVRLFVAAAARGIESLPVGRINLAVDARVLLFVGALVLITGLTFGLLPALHASRPNLVPALKGREVPPRYRFLGIRNLLAGAQVGGSLVLVLVSLLLAKSLAHASHLDPGFRAQGVAVVELDLSHTGYGEAEGRQLFASLQERVGALPGATRTALAERIPLEGGSTLIGGLEPEGYEPAPGEHFVAPMSTITPGYLELMRIRLLRGRDFTAEDKAGAERVMLVSQAFVDRFWPGESGVGKQVRSSGGPPYRVVGVVADIPWGMPGEEPKPTVWLPYSQFYVPHMILHVRTAGDPMALLPSLRTEAAALDPDLPIARIDRLESITAHATFAHRVLSLVLGIAGAVTLALAMLGIYGVVAFSVSQRTREVGLRLALGAEPGVVVRMVVRQGIGLALIGLVPGILVSIVAALLMRAALLGLQPLDPVAFGGSVGLLLLAVVAASLVPARKAAGAHPMDALRQD